MIDKPKQCQYLSECNGKEKTEYEAKLQSVNTWSGLCCQKCLIAMQKLIYRNNFGVLNFKKFDSETWTQYCNENDPSHEGRTDLMA